MSLVKTSNLHARIRRWIWRAAAVLFATIFAILSLAVLSLNLPWVRTFVRTRVNHGLSEVFVGQLSIDRIGHLGLDFLGGIDAHLLDGAGNQIVTVRGLRVRSNWPTIILQLIRNQPLDVRLSPLLVDHVDVWLVAGRDGTPTLVRAFNPRHPKPPGPGDTQISIDIDGLRVRHIWAHGSLPSLAAIDSELIGLKGKLRSGRAGLSGSIDAGHILARALPGRVDPDGDITVSIALPPEGVEGSRGVAMFTGSLASAPATLNARIDGKSVEVALEALAIPPSAIHAQLQNSALKTTTSLQARLHGRLPALEYVAELDNVEAGHLLVKGQAHLGEGTRAACLVTASNVNLAPILGYASRTSLSADASANATFGANGALDASFQLHLPRSRFDDYETPPASTHGNLSRSESGSLRLSGALFVDEPGAPVHARYELQVKPDSNPQLHASLQARLANPSRLTRLAGLSATGTLDASADLDIPARRLSAEAKVSLASVVHERVNARSLNMQASARGELGSPYLKIAAVSKDVQVSDRRFRNVRVDGDGTLKRLHLLLEAHDTTEERIELEANVVPGQVLLVERPQFTITDRRGQVTGRAQAVRIARRVSVEAFELKGLGSVRATGSFSPQDVDTHFAIHDLDLARLSRLTHLEIAQHGTLSLEGHVAGPFDNLRGQIQGQARAVNARGMRGAQFDLNVDASNRVLNGTLEGKLGSSTLRAQLADLRLPTKLRSKALLKDVKGELSINAALSLEELATFFGSTGVPIEHASGRLTLDLHVQNEAPNASGPTLHAAVKTQGLRIVQKRPQQSNIKSPSQAREAEPHALEGIDLDLVLDVDPSLDESSVDLTLSDRLGRLAELKAQTKAPRLTVPDLQASFRELPFNVNLRLPERAMQKWPRAVRPSVMRGLASFALDAQGTIDAPRAVAHLTVRKLQSREGKYSVDLQAESHYEGNGGNIEGHARSTRGGTAELQAKWTGNLLQHIRHANANTSYPLDLSADVLFRGFPVGVVPAISDRQVRGPLSGEVHLRGLGRDATLQARLDASGVNVNRVSVSRLIAVASVDNDKINATIDAVQGRGTAHARFDTTSAWGQRWVPQVDPHAQVELKAHQFQLATLSPLFLAYVSTLEGLLDADISAHFGDDKPVISGTASISQGVIQIPEIGQRFSDAQAKVSIHEDEVRVDAIQARGITGRVTGDAKAKVNGIELVSASARLDIREKEKLPVTFEGVMIGDAWGHVNFAYSGGQTASNAATEIKVDVPQFHLKMPEEAQNSVQDLGAADKIRIGAHRIDGKFVEIPLQPLEPATPEGEAPQLTRMLVHLGDGVWIERDRQVKVQLAGDVEIDSGGERRVRGRIELKGGKLDVSGKQFDIERGVVTFEGSDPSNPTVTATARWDSPANYAVYADYVGSVKNGKLKLHSEPNLSQDEILSLLLFGAPDGSVAASSNSNGAIGNIANGSPDQTKGKSGDSTSGAGAAISVAGGTATQGLNRAISDVTNLDVSTRIDTSTGSARPELVVQLTPRLTTRVTRAIGEPVPGESPDRTFLTLELRLKRSWALSAIVGDHGASTLDMIWRKRY